MATTTATLRRRIPSAKMPSTKFVHSPRYSGSTGSRPSDATSSSRPGRPSAGLAGLEVTEEERNAIIAGIEIAEEDNEEKTFSRRFVENVLSKYDWYWPGRANKASDAPSLSRAWRYYEHVTLPRHYKDRYNADTVMRKAEPGESEGTELYDPFRLPQASLIEWGTGMDLYFISLRFFSFVMLVLGIINIGSIQHYASDDYNGGAGVGVEGFLRSPILSTSAICTNTQWVVCTNCEQKNWEGDNTRYALAGDDNNTILVQRTFCSGIAMNGWINYTTLILVVAMVGVFSYYLRLREIRFDEDKVTTTDYSVLVKNPPPEAIDPNEWRDFFSQFATDGDQVTAVTVALNNELLVRKLVQRRIFREQLRAKLPPHINLDDEVAVDEAVDKLLKEQSKKKVGCLGKTLNATLIPFLNLFGMLLPADQLMARVGTLADEIKELQEKEYFASKVFVTFETEDGQRAALDALKVGRLNLMVNNTHAVNPSCLFRGKVLYAVEPTEPNAVRWTDLSEPRLSKMIRQGITMMVTVGMIAFAGLCVAKARAGVGPFFSGILTTIFNSTIPQIIKILMIIEPHSTEGSFQASLYLKITLFRWTLSAILTQIITPHTSTLGNLSTDLLPTIYAILLSDTWLTPLLRLSDWFTNIQKHIIAPRADTQAEMNSWFQGTYYNLGERYTDFTKVLFVVFYYSALFPIGFFFGFLILTFQYYSDKFCLVRIWSWSPLLGAELAVYSRRFFFTGATIALAAVSSIVWAQFPYDHVCDPLEGNAISGLSGTYTGVRNLDNELVDDGTVFVEQDTNVVQCLQNWRSYEGFAIPATPRYQTDNKSWRARVDETQDLQWMDDKQSVLTLVYGWTSTIIILIFVAGMFGRAISTFIISFFTGTYEPEGDQQHIDFSSNPDIFAYVPQIKRIGQPFPFLVCDIDAIDQGLIGWNDPARSYDYYNLIFDIPHKSLKRTNIIEQNTRGATTIAEHDEYGLQSVRSAAARGEFRPIYSIIAHYPTKWQLELARVEVEAEGLEDRIAANLK